MAINENLKLSALAAATTGKYCLPAKLLRYSPLMHENSKLLEWPNMKRSTYQQIRGFNNLLLKVKLNKILIKGQLAYPF